jgi:hypothetical protein
MESRCRHYEGGQCGLAHRMVEGLEETVGALPPCVIRKTCRWHAEVGPRACLRCSQVVTRLEDPSPEVKAIVRPGATA